MYKPIESFCIKAKTGDNRHCCSQLCLKQAYAGCNCSLGKVKVHTYVFCRANKNAQGLSVQASGETESIHTACARIEHQQLFDRLSS